MIRVDTTLKYTLGLIMKSRGMRNVLPGRLTSNWVVLTYSSILFELYSFVHLKAVSGDLFEALNFKIQFTSEYYAVNLTENIISNGVNEIVVISAFLLLLGSGVIIILNKLNKKNKQLTAENAMLIREQNHRVKNNLQLISSLLSLQAHQSTGRSRDEILAGSRRIQAIALLHRNLYMDNRGLREVSIKQFTEELVDDTLYEYGLGKVPVVLNLEEISMPVDKAVHVALILNELLMNSLVHVFDKQPIKNATIEIDLYKRDGFLVLEYQDRSEQFCIENYQKSNALGKQIIESQSGHLSNKYAVTNDHGFSYHIEIEKD